MFTGLIEQVGTLQRVAQEGEKLRLEIAHGAWEQPLSPGESVAVQGVCLTVFDPRPDGFSCNALKETVARTNLLSGRKRVNLERALRLGDRLGGHLVSGHVDGLGTVQAIRQTGADWVLSIGCGAELLGGIVPKGSIGCDGVSLTVAALTGAGFELHIIPFTWEHTALHALAPGDAVNLETDMFGKYVYRYLETHSQQRPPAVTDALLEKCGFI